MKIKTFFFSFLFFSFLSQTASAQCGELSFGTPQLTNDGMTVDIIYTNPPSNITFMDIDIELSNLGGIISLDNTDNSITGTNYNATDVSLGGRRITLYGNSGLISLPSSVIATLHFFIPVGSTTTIDFGTVMIQTSNSNICSSGIGNITLTNSGTYSPTTSIEFSGILERFPGEVSTEDMTGAEVFAEPQLNFGFIFEETNTVTRINTTNLFTLPIFPEPDYELGMRDGNLAPCAGVTTFDLVSIRKHILGIEHFSEVWKYFAADASDSGTISTFDLIEIKQQILQIDDLNPSWKFFPLDAEGMLDIPLPSVPNQTPNVSETITYSQVQQNISGISFSAIKLGDLTPNECGYNNIPPTSTDVKRDVYIKSGKTYPDQTGYTIQVAIPEFVKQEVFSIGLDFDTTLNMNITGIKEGNFTGLDSTAYSIHPDGKGIDIVWYNMELDGITIPTSGGTNTGYFFIKVTGTPLSSGWNGLVDLNYDKVANVIFTKVPAGQKTEAYFEIVTSSSFQSDASNQYESLTNDILDIKVSPVPFSSELRFEIYHEHNNTTATLEIMDLTGRVLLTKQLDLEVGYNDIWLEKLNHLPRGVLSYRLLGQELSTSGKIIKH